MVGAHCHPRYFEIRTWLIVRGILCVVLNIDNIVIKETHLYTVESVFSSVKMLGKIIYVSILLVNSMAVLNEERFLARGA